MSTKPTFLLVHGTWHGAWCWSEMTTRLAKAGYPSVALDLLGCGADARFPESFLKRPIDAGAFAKEMSPSAGITQEARNAEVIAAVRSAASVGNGKVVLVGHSWGGLTISHVAEAVPDLIQSLVYITSFMLPNGMSPGAMLEDPSFKDTQTFGVLCADPADVGALRVDSRSEDPAYIAAVKQAYYADVDDTRFRAISNMLCCDEPAQTVGVPMAISTAKFGSIKRNYVRMGNDNSIPPVAQDRMIELTDADVGNKTQVHRLDGSHSPFYAQPDTLLEVLLKAV